MISSSNSLSGYVSRAELLSKDNTTSIFQFDKAYWPQPAMSAIRPPADYSAQEFASYGHQHHGALPPDAAAPSRAEDQGGMADYPGHSEQDRNGRPKRKRISPQQLDTLLSLFQQTDTPSYEQRERVAARLSMSNREVQVWFQNRRAKERNAKQKQQLMEHRERLERVESASQLHDKTPTPPVEPVFSSAQAFSSPAQPSIDPFPSSFNPARRRSLSTSALDTATVGVSDIAFRSPYQHATSDHHQSQFSGPIRPHFNRYHTIHPQYAFGRPSSARPDMAPPASRSPPYSLSRLGSADRAQDSSGSRREELSLPLPNPRYRFGHSPTSSFSNSRPSSSGSNTIADRRENRLPPIRMLLDIADNAAADFSPALSGVPSSSHSCGLYSPFSDLQLHTPGSEDGRQTEYFSARDIHAGRHAARSEVMTSQEYSRS